MTRGVCLSALFTKSSRYFEYPKYTGAYHPKIFLYTFFVLSWIVQYTLSTGSNLGQDCCVQQCTLETWLHPISFSKKAKSQKNLLIFYPLHYTVDLHPKDCFGTFWNLPPNQECLIMILLCTIEIAYKKPYFSFGHLL